MRSRPLLFEATMGSFSRIQASSSSTSRKSCWTANDSIRRCFRLWRGSMSPLNRSSRLDALATMVSASKWPVLLNWSAAIRTPSIRSDHKKKEIENQFQLHLSIFQFLSTYLDVRFYQPPLRHAFWEHSVRRSSPAKSQKVLVTTFCDSSQTI